MEWKPIESAPKDGTTILIFGRPSPLIIDGNELLVFKKAGAFTAAWDEVDGMFCVSGGSWLGPFVEPTHWMPLPEAPK